MSSLALSLKEQLKTERQAAIASFQVDGKPERLLIKLRQNVDAALTRAWQSFRLPASAALVAVGGYGRGELFPHSDVDVLILLPHAADRACAEAIERLLTSLWDAGIELSHAVRTLDECASEMTADATVATSLLEQRHLAGSRTLQREFERMFDARLDLRTFYDAK